MNHLSYRPAGKHTFASIKIPVGRLWNSSSLVIGPSVGKASSLRSLKQAVDDPFHRYTRPTMRVEAHSSHGTFYSLVRAQSSFVLLLSFVSLLLTKFNDVCFSG